MKLTFDKSQCFTVPEKLYQILNDELANHSLPDCDTEGIIFNFRDPDYSSDNGGFHPVEIRLVKHVLAGKVQWQFEYMTDFSFQGYPFAELTKEIDVCFRTKQVYNLFGGWLSKAAGDELMAIFLENFISYIEMNIFTVTINFD